MSDATDLRAATEVRWVALPAGAEPPVTAYVNGETRTEGDGLTVRDGRVIFDPPLHARPKLGFGRTVMLALGVGVYGDLKGDTLDLTFRRNGRTESRAEVRLVPTPPEDASA